MILFRSLLVLALLMLPFWGSEVLAHNELVATYVIEKYENQYYLKAILEKHQFTQAIRKEGDCPASEMISSCGKKYVLEHLKMLMNGREIVLEKVGQDVRKENIEMLFEISGFSEQLENLQITSNYLFSYNPHARIRVYVNLKDAPVSYTLSPERIKMTYRSN